MKTFDHDERGDGRGWNGNSDESPSRFRHGRSLSRGREGRSPSGRNRNRRSPSRGRRGRSLSRGRRDSWRTDRIQVYSPSDGEEAPEEVSFFSKVRLMRRNKV